jgi:hypothetical protein
MSVGAKHSPIKFGYKPENYLRECFAPTPLLGFVPQLNLHI